MDRLAQLQHLANDNRGILALWLYGSRARGDNDADSDYDLAVLFSEFEWDAMERRLRPELLAQEWAQQANLPLDKISAVDIFACPIPLAWTILNEGHLLVDKSPDRRRVAENRVYSIWELDYLHATEATG